MNPAATDKSRRRGLHVVRWIGLRLCIAVAMGAATTVGVAWTGAAWTRTLEVPEAMRVLHMNSNQFLTMMRSRGLVEEIWWLHDPNAKIELPFEQVGWMSVEHVPSWSLLADAKAAIRWSTMTDPDAGDEFAGLTHSGVVEVATGWPRPAMVARFREFAADGGFPFRCINGIALPPWSERSSEVVKYQARALPTVVLWSGSGYNTLLVAFWCAAALLGPGMVGWWRVYARVRRYRRPCRGCGYPLRGLSRGARCPECGKVPSPPRATNSVAPLR